MRHIWNYFDQKNWCAINKYRACAAVAVILYGILGFVVWSLIRHLALDHWTWMLIFIGWPAFAAFLGVFFYSGGHEMHDGTPSEIEKAISIPQNQTGSIL